MFFPMNFEMSKFHTVLLHKLPKIKKVVQVGACDGVYADPIYNLSHLFKEWEMLLIEPVPHLFEKLKHNYRNRPNTYFENAALIFEDNPQDTLGPKKVEMKVHSNTAINADGIGMSSLTTVKHNCFTYSEGTESEKFYPYEIEEVNAVNIVDLFNKYPDFKDVDLLIVDTEGYDHKILDCFAQQSILPEVVHFETRHMESAHFYNLKKWFSDREYHVMPYCASKEDYDYYGDKGNDVVMFKKIDLETNK